MKDVRNTLKERWLQLFWPEDGRWWPGQVLDIRCKERKVHLLYKTGARPAPTYHLQGTGRGTPVPGNLQSDVAHFHCPVMTESALTLCNCECCPPGLSSSGSKLRYGCSCIAVWDMSLSLLRCSVARLSHCTLDACQNGCVSAGEEETDLDLGDLIKKGEVAWLSAEEMMKASEVAQSGTYSFPPASEHCPHHPALHGHSQSRAEQAGSP